MQRQRERMRSDGVTEVEYPWMLALEDGGGTVAVRDELVRQGIPLAQAAGIVLWLHDQLDLRRVNNEKTVWRYRALLASLTPPDRRASLRTIPG
jgi:hypothetical protein